MNEKVYERFKIERAKQEDNKIFFGDAYIDNDFVFKWNDGKPFNPSYYSRGIKLLSEKAGLSPVRFHDLRHSCATILKSCGVDLMNIQRWLGHSSITTTAKIYVHMDFKDKINTANTLSMNLFN